MCVHYLSLKYLCPRLLYPINHIIVGGLIVLSIIIYIYNRYVSTRIMSLKKKVYDSQNYSFLLVK